MTDPKLIAMWAVRSLSPRNLCQIWSLSIKCRSMLNMVDLGPRNMAFIMYGRHQRNNLGRFGKMSVRAAPMSHYMPPCLQQLQDKWLCLCWPTPQPQRKMEPPQWPELVLWYMTSASQTSRLWSKSSFPDISGSLPSHCWLWPSAWPD